MYFNSDGIVRWTYINRAKNNNVYRLGWSRILYLEEDIKKVRTYYYLNQIMIMIKNNKLMILILFFTYLSPLFAYIGPGMSGALYTIFGIIGSIFLQLLAYYTIQLKGFEK